MFSQFLLDTLTKSGRELDGCGMSPSPSYYSGRGATRCDLDDSKLEKLWNAIKTHRGDKAAEAFVRMVESIKVISATDFLLALAAFDAAGFKWEHSMLPRTGGIYATDPIGALCTVVSHLSYRENDTRAIKDPFLRRRGRKIKGGESNPYGF